MAKTDKELLEDGILKEHNFEVYRQVEEMLETSDRVALVQATGTGKSFVTIQLLYDHFLMNDKKVLILTPNYPIIRQLNRNLHDVALDRETAFPNVEEIIYANLGHRSEEDWELLKGCYDLIVLDEFHRVGAEVWGQNVKKLIELNPKAKVFGLSATPVRFLEKRDMGREIFGGNIVEGLSLREAIEKKVLPTPEYVTAVYSYGGVVDNLQNRVDKVKNKHKQQRLQGWLEKAKRQIEIAEGLEDTFGRKIKKSNSKFVIFCSNLKQIDEIKDRIKQGLFAKVNPNVKVYQVTYRDRHEKIDSEIKAFEEDDSSDLKVMLSVDLFNEGLHIKGVDGCIMFRPTISPRIYLQQIGRALSVENNKQPIIFDIVNNIQSLRDVAVIFGDDEDVSRERLAELQQLLPFHIDEKNLEIMSMLMQLDDIFQNFSVSNDAYIDCAKRYADKFGDLKVSALYVDEGTGICFGTWLNKFKLKYANNPNSVNENVKNELLKIDSHVFEYTRKFRKEMSEQKIKKFAELYFKECGNLAVTMDEKLKHDVFDEETGENVTQFLYKIFPEIKKFVKNPNEKRRTKFSRDLVSFLLDLDPRVFETKYAINLRREKDEEKILRCAEIYFQEHGCLAFSTSIGSSIVTDPVTGDEVNFINVLNDLRRSQTSRNQRFSQKFVDALLAIDKRILEPNYCTNLIKELREEKDLKFARIYFEKYGNLAVTLQTGKVVDEETGEIFDLNSEFKKIKAAVGGNSDYRYSDEFLQKLTEMDPRVFEKNYAQNLFRERKEQAIFRCAQIYFSKFGNLAVSLSKKNNDNIIVDPVTQAKINLAQEIMNIRLYRNGYDNNGNYSDFLMESLEAMDPRVFERRYAKNFRRENRTKSD